jgi:sterol desaturase/sphingolipid hydroxylase (fatty acid hydroxylase superfamily)
MHPTLHWYLPYNLNDDDHPSYILFATAFQYALQAALALLISHGTCVLILMYLDLSGQWKTYTLHPHGRRSVTVADYLIGLRSFVADIILLFIPIMTLCFVKRVEPIQQSTDSWVLAVLKLIAGYVCGKLWAFGVHYLLHLPYFYHRYHRRHHCHPRQLIASAAWQDSYVEYLVMELPSFAITVVFFPTHFAIHLLHFAFHGLDGAAGHSGFKAPGVLGYIFDGEYHYYHHAYLTVNYAELELIDRLFGTHHTYTKSVRFQKSHRLNIDNKQRLKPVAAVVVASGN